MPYPFDQIFAVDPERTDMVAANSSVLVFEPGDATKTPVRLTTLSGLPLQNPIPTNDRGFTVAPMAEIPEIAWESGAGHSGTMKSFTGVLSEAVAARQAAQEAALEAQAPTDLAVDRGIQRANIAGQVAAAIADGPVMAGVVARYMTTEGNPVREAIATAAEMKRSVDIREYGAIDGKPDNTAAIRDAAAAAAGQLLVIPQGVWSTDPVSLESGTTVHIYGTLRLRNGANLPSNNGVLYAYGTATNRKSRVKIHGFGGKIDGNRAGQTQPLSFDMEGINFKYLDHGEIVGVEVFNAIESGIDLDTSTNCIIRDVYSHHNYGNGFHMSNGALDNLLQGNIAEANGFGNDRNGFDQYAGGANEPANRNRYIGNRAVGNNRNYKINGVAAIFSDNTSLDGAKPDEVTANIMTLDPRPAVRIPAAPTLVATPTGGAVVDSELRTAFEELRSALGLMGLVGGPTLFAHDDFERAANTVGLGTSSSGVTWNPPTGYWEITSSGKAKRNAAANAATAAHFSGLASSNFRIMADITTSPGRTLGGFAFRSTGADWSGASDYLTAELYAVGSTTAVRLRKREGGNSSILASFSMPLVASTKYELSVEAVGGSVSIKVNGAPTLAYDLTGPDLIKFGALGYAGIWSNVTGSGDDGGTLWDNVKVYRFPA